MRITVVLCTYNRSELLSKALNSVAGQMLPRSIEWEVLVVDNNSTDRTPEVVADFCRQYPGRFRYLFEPQPGLSRARNAGIQAATGDILAFMDDDVTVETTWLQNLTEAMQNGDWAGAGGRVLPTWSSSPPRWLSVKGRYALAPFALFDVGSEAGPLAEPPFGANMAFRKAMFEKYGAFRIDLGRCPGSLMSNEDTEFGRRLLTAGEHLYYEPSAVVYHPVPENRLQKKYLLAWWFDKGRADIRQFGVRRDAKTCYGIPLYLFRRLAVWTLGWTVAVDPRVRFARKLNVWEKLGEIQESYYQTRDAKGSKERTPCPKPTA